MFTEHLALCWIWHRVVRQLLGSLACAHSRGISAGPLCYCCLCFQAELQWRTPVEQVQLHQHASVCGRGAGRAWGGDSHHDVSTKRHTGEQSNNKYTVSVHTYGHIKKKKKNPLKNDLFWQRWWSSVVDTAWNGKKIESVVLVSKYKQCGYCTTSNLVRWVIIDFILSTFQETQGHCTSNKESTKDTIIKSLDKHIHRG